MIILADERFILLTYYNKQSFHLFQVYPLDYVFMFLVVAVLFICAVGGINTIGIWFLWIRVSVLSQEFLRISLDCQMCVCVCVCALCK